MMQLTLRDLVFVVGAHAASPERIHTMEGTMNTRSERVRLGIAEVLDVEFPDWLTRIDLSRLDIGSTFDCILGQLHREQYVGYWRDLEKRHPSWGIADGLAYLAAHGFTATGTGDTVDELTETWKQTIAALRG